MTALHLTPDSPLKSKTELTLCTPSHTHVLRLSRDLSFAELPNLPADWRLCVHPKGWIYFYHEGMRVVTDSDVRDPFVHLRIMDQINSSGFDDLGEEMEVQVHTGHISLLSSVTDQSHLHLHVNHKNCIASYNLQEVLSEHVALLSPDDFNRRRRMYWNYLWNHPAHIPTPDRAVSEATDALTWFYTDNLISGAKSVAPFSKAECEDLSRVIKDLTLPCNSDSVSKTVFLSWLLREVCSFRDAEHYGRYTLKQSQAFDASRQPARFESRTPGWLSQTILNFVTNFLFFSIPWTYLAHVKSSSEFRGRLANVQKNWEEYIARLVREYSHFLLISTVLLSATVSFLALPDIAQAARVAGTVSTFTSLGSIIVGVFSIWRHQTNSRTAASFTYMHNAQRSYLGYHGHAMLLSLPPVLLVWSIVTFSISIVAYTLQGITDQDVFDRGSTLIIIAVFAVILIMVALALYTFSIIWKFKQPRIWPWWLHPGRSGRNKTASMA
ncbi:hypothetical protein HGRIS_009717 [Hohenbuehelia grisea]|uniref:WW domain-containing protein n=1 Tax=Hohenbuehelia grisea TaxID=104357 RepID=A0ABR3J267_9AGAR